jgi:hypothetical protein
MRLRPAGENPSPAAGETLTRSGAFTGGGTGGGVASFRCLAALLRYLLALEVVLIRLIALPLCAWPDSRAFQVMEVAIRTS